MSYYTRGAYYDVPQIEEKKTAKITRIDLFEHPEGILVRKFEECWHPGTVAKEAYIVKDQTIEELIALVNQDKWFVRRWPGGCRMWLGDKAIPVRGKIAIQKMRERYEESRAHGTLDERIQLINVNFALDF